MSCRVILADHSTLVGPAWPLSCQWVVRLDPNGRDWARITADQLGEEPQRTLQLLLTAAWEWETEEGEMILETASGRQLRLPEDGSCVYVRVCDARGQQLNRWDLEHISQYPSSFLGALLGLLSWRN